MFLLPYYKSGFLEINERRAKMIAKVRLWLGRDSLADPHHVRFAPESGPKSGAADIRKSTRKPPVFSGGEETRRVELDISRVNLLGTVSLISSLHPKDHPNRLDETGQNSRVPSRPLARAGQINQVNRLLSK